MINSLRRVTLLSKKIVDACISEGDIAIDATCGRGDDTLHLAKRVGENGHVYAMDIQEMAIDETRKRLNVFNLGERVSVLQMGHERIDSILNLIGNKEIKVIMFNLGFLPGGNKNLTTKSKTTLEAVEKSLQLLAAGGIVTICVYPHDEGMKEADALEVFCAKLDKRFLAHKFETINRNSPPYLILIEKLKTG